MKNGKKWRVYNFEGTDDYGIWNFMVVYKFEKSKCFYEKICLMASFVIQELFPCKFLYGNSKFEKLTLDHETLLMVKTHSLQFTPKAFQIILPWQFIIGYLHNT